MIELDKKKQQECGIDKGCSLTNVTAAQCLKRWQMLVTASFLQRAAYIWNYLQEKESLDKKAKKEYFVFT